VIIPLINQGLMQLQFKRNTMEIELQKENLEYLFYALLLLLVLLLVVTLSIGTHSLCIFINSLAATLLFNLSSLVNLNLQNSTY